MFLIHKKYKKKYYLLYVIKISVLYKATSCRKRVSLSHHNHWQAETVPDLSWQCLRLELKLFLDLLLLFQIMHVCIEGGCFCLTDKNNKWKWVWGRPVSTRASTHFPQLFKFFLVGGQQGLFIGAFGTDFLVQMACSYFVDQDPMSWNGRVDKLQLCS